ncbi:MAG: glycosyltransferase [Cryomorphaceae bacterium]|nr:glycosyltransferase [Cryomorphaceae bacterium]
MKLSIVIVNYNVRYFLEQCLQSVQVATANIDSEVFVVDNASSDDSLEMVRNKFPDVVIIENTNNVGFSVANNQAIRQSKGEYVLLLNPDTIVREDTFVKSLQFMDDHPDAGALGIRMIDGTGGFLPESKRGFPTPWVAFCKIIGLTALFPKSPVFAQYYMGHLSSEENQEVDVLAGAYMLLRAKTLEKIGLLDEVFFMYGEDIDLSYRVQLGGFKNYYLADSEIIHYKGESTKKGSLNYVYVFYKAMAIFARKHFKGSEAGIYLLFIQMGIVFRAVLAGMGRIFKKLGLPLADAVLTYGALMYLKHYWERNHRFVSGGEYPEIFSYFVLPAYVLIWMLFAYLQGAYDKPQRKTTAIRAVAFGTLGLLIGYALLSEDWRFSRALILMGAVCAAAIFTVNRLAADWFDKGRLLQKSEVSRRFFVVGNKSEARRARKIIRDAMQFTSFIGWIPENETQIKSDWQIGDWSEITSLISTYRPNEIVFCSADLTHTEIMNRMREIRDFGLEVKILPTDSQFIIGSNSIHQQGETYMHDVRGLFIPMFRRQKRLFDLISSGVLLLLFPLTVVIAKRPGFILSSAISVFTGRKTWIGYSKGEVAKGLPVLPPGVFSQGDQLRTPANGNTQLQKLNFLYATQYALKDDAEVLWGRVRG